MNLDPISAQRTPKIKTSEASKVISRVLAHCGVVGGQGILRTSAFPDLSGIINIGGFISPYAHGELVKFLGPYISHSGLMG